MIFDFGFSKKFDISLFRPQEGYLVAVEHSTYMQVSTFVYSTSLLLSVIRLLTTPFS